VKSANVKNASFTLSIVRSQGDVMLIAVATKDGKEINQHFGHAERFLIYEVSDAAVKLVDEKKVERYCTYDEAHPLRGHVLRGISAALAGCRAIVCAQIGQAPQEEMAQQGFPVYALHGAIKPALAELVKVL
jgi:predicted Fe-Mo cluster-binding NifX family protein